MVSLRDVLGAQFLVQSPTRSCEYIVSCINKFLIDARERVHFISYEDFEI